MVLLSLTIHCNRIVSAVLLTITPSCFRCEANVDPQGKVDDIHTLDKKLRSLFSDLGGAAPAAQGELPAGDPAAGAPVAGTTTPVGPFSTSTTSVTPPSSGQPANVPVPPTTLALATGGPLTAAQGPGTPTSTPAQTSKHREVPLA